MNKHNQKTASKKGFTIIEVVLVLAIAGLIFLMVFIALPALQKGQRDAQRKSDLTRISVQMTQYLTSTKGVIPNNATTLGDFVRGYLDGESSDVASDDYADPVEGNYTIDLSPQQAVQQGHIGYYPRHTCNAGSSNGVQQTTAARQYAFTIKLENQTAVFCLDSKS